MTIVALDIDLHKIYAVSDEGAILAKAEPNIHTVIGALGYLGGPGRGDDRVLVEVASPVMYIKDPAVVHNVIRWALWNITAACLLDSELNARVRVAPSHVWTRGHALKVRHEVAGCKQKQKDLRECEAMIFYYNANPSAWKTMADYLKEL